jgi:hypothetical protein
MRDRPFYAFKISLEKNRENAFAKHSLCEIAQLPPSKFPLRRTGGSAITLITTFIISLEKKLGNVIALFTTLRFSLEKKRGSAITLITTFKFSLEKN